MMIKTQLRRWIAAALILFASASHAAITVNVAIAPGFGSSATTAVAPDVTVGSGSDRYVVAITGQRDFGEPGAVSGVDIESSALSQLGTDQAAFGVLIRSTIWGLVAPGTGANRTLTATFASSTLLSAVGGIVYDGVDQTTPTRDVDQGSTDSGAPGTSVSPSLTLTTESGDRVVMLIIMRHADAGAVTVSGETERVNGNGSGSINVIVVDKTASGTSTTINPTLSFSSADYQLAYFAVALRPAGGGGGGTPSQRTTLGAG